MQDKHGKATSVKRVPKILIKLSIISFFISSVTILFMPLGSFEPDGNIMLAYILAGAFWLFLILGIVLMFVIGAKRRKDKLFTDTGGIAFLRFFKNRPAIVFDLLLIASILSLVVSLLYIRTLPAAITLAGTFTMVFSLEMHAVLNGKNYEWSYTELDLEYKFMLD